MRHSFRRTAVLHLTLPLNQAAEDYKAMDERRATKVLLTL
jgi:hypothetical protein